MVKANGPVAAALRLSGAKTMRVVSLIEYKVQRPDGGSIIVPGITYVSVGHRPSLLRYHASRLRLYGMDQAPSYAVEAIDDAVILQQAKEEREMADQTAW